MALKLLVLLPPTPSIPNYVGTNYFTQSNRPFQHHGPHERFHQLRHWPFGQHQCLDLGRRTHKLGNRDQPQVPPRTVAESPHGHRPTLSPQRLMIQTHHNNNPLSLPADFLSLFPISLRVVFARLLGSSFFHPRTCSDSLGSGGGLCHSVQSASNRQKIVPADTVG